MPSDIVKRCCKKLTAAGLKIAFVESATSGRMCAEFALGPEPGKYLVGGLACYDAELKKGILNVPHEVIRDHTPESSEVTELLARGGKQYFGSDVIVAVTGLTTPGGSETPEKPVGTMFLHILIGTRSLSHREVFTGGAEDIMLKAIDTAARMISERL